MKIKTFLPLFPGFYNSDWSIDDKENDYLEREDVKFEDIETDHAKYNEDVAKLVCEFVKNNCSVISRVKFEAIYSPKYYNYGNDSINVEITFSETKLAKFLIKNKSKLVVFLKENYTSYDGFWSSYSNEYEVWFSDTSGFTVYDDEHKLGSLLDFYFQANDITSSDALDYVDGRIDVDDYITTTYREIYALHDFERVKVAMKAYDLLDLTFGYMAVLVNNFLEAAEGLGETIKEYLCQRETDTILNEAKISKVDSNLEIIFN